MSEPQWQLETLAVHGGYRPDPTTRAVAVPIYQTVAYAFDDTQHGADLFDLKVPGNIYTRIMNPTTDVLEQRLAALEGGIGALALASGQAAITYALQTIAEAGDNIVASSALYGGSLNLLAHTLPQYAIQARFADPADPSAFAALIDERTKAVFVESIGNPRGNVTDIAAIAEVAHAAGVPLIVDNTVATPFLLRPFEHGADIVVHSLTKYLGGHGNSLGGAIIDSGRFDWAAQPKRFARLNQPDPSYHGVVYTEALGPAAYITRAGGPAAQYRCRVVAVQCVPDPAGHRDPGPAHGAHQRQCTGRRAVPEGARQGRLGALRGIGRRSRACRRAALSGWARLGRTDLRPARHREAGARFLDALKLFTRLVNLGDAKSLATHPASTTHRQLDAAELVKAGVSEDTVRLSIGIEHIGDLRADLEQALAAA